MYGKKERSSNKENRGETKIKQLRAELKSPESNIKKQNLMKRYHYGNLET